MFFFGVIKLKIRKKNVFKAEKFEGDDPREVVQNLVFGRTMTVGRAREEMDVVS